MNAKVKVMLVTKYFESMDFEVSVRLVWRSPTKVERQMPGLITMVHPKSKREIKFWPFGNVKDKPVYFEKD